VPGATGKEVAIFDLYPNAGAFSSFCPLHTLSLLNYRGDSAPAVNVVAKGIHATTESHSKVAVMCNSTAVSGLCEACAVCLIDPSLNFQISTDVGFKCWNGTFVRTKAGK